METGIVAHFLSPINQKMTEVNQRMKSNFYTKIPPYARDYKKEYLYIRGLNKEFKYFINKLDKLNEGLFESNIADRIKYFMKRFLRAQEKGKLKDFSEFVIYEDDVDNLIFINDQFRMYKIRWDFFNASDDGDDGDDGDDDNDDDGDDDDDDNDDDDVYVGIDDSDDEYDEDYGKNVYPGFKEIYDILKLFFSKIKYKGSDSDSDCDCDSDIEIEDFNIILPDSDDDSDSDNF